MIQLISELQNVTAQVVHLGGKANELVKAKKGKFF